MVDAPEKIWAASVTENYGEWQTTTDGLPRPTEYTRSDLVAELAAENERLTNQRDYWQSQHDERTRQLGQSAEALSRTGAMKVLDPDMPAQEMRLHMGEMTAQEMRTARAEAAERLAGARVKALEWSTNWGTIKAETPIGHYFIEARRDGSFDCRLENIWKTWASSSDAAKAAAQADYERRILSAIAGPAGEFDRIVSDSSEFVASLSDSMRATGRSVFNTAEPAGKVEPSKWTIPGSSYAGATTPPDASAIREALEAIRALSGLDGELCKASATIMSRMADIHQTADAALAGAKP